MSQEPRVVSHDSFSRQAKKYELATRIQEAEELEELDELDELGVLDFLKKKKNSKFKEELHPRGDGGKFAKSPKGGSLGKGIADQKEAAKKILPKDRKSIFDSITANGSPGFLKDVVGLAAGAIDEVLMFLANMPGVDILERTFGNDNLALYYPSIRSIDVNRDAEWKATSLIHELGHHIDRNTFLGQSFLGDDKGLLDSMLKSKRMLKAKAGLDNPDKAAFSEYLLNKKEMFARAFTQYVVTKASNKVLKTELKEDTTQWDDEDFKPISNQFDRMFKDLKMKR